jgi:HSP20 family protein
MPPDRTGTWIATIVRLSRPPSDGVVGEKAEERQEGDEGKRYHVWERHYGSFQRSFTLPRTVRPDEISAEFENGILRVRMPKAAEAKGRRIAIGSGQEVKG